MPKEKEDKKKKKKQQKPPKKNDKKEDKPIAWADPPKPRAPTTLELITKATQEMESSIFPQNIRQMQCNTLVMPSVIKESYFPPKAPNEVATLIESALVYQHAANYMMAIKTLEDARDIWRKLEPWEPPVKT